MSLPIHDQTFIEALRFSRSRGSDQVRVSRSDPTKIRSATLFERVQGARDRLNGRTQAIDKRTAAVRSLLLEKLAVELAACARLEFGDIDLAESSRALAQLVLDDLPATGELTEVGIVMKLHGFAVAFDDKAAAIRQDADHDSKLKRSLERLVDLNQLMMDAGAVRKFFTWSVNQCLQHVKADTAARDRQPVGHERQRAMVKSALWVRKHGNRDYKAAFWFGSRMSRPPLAGLDHDTAYRAVCHALEKRDAKLRQLNLPPGHKPSPAQTADLQNAFEKALKDFVAHEQQLALERRTYQDIRQFHPRPNKRALAKLISDPLFQNNEQFRQLAMPEQLAVAAAMLALRNDAKANGVKTTVENREADLNACLNRQRWHPAERALSPPRSVFRESSARQPALPGENDWVL